MGAMRTPEAPRARAMSSARLVSLFSRTPWSSSSSYRVTEGPRVTLTMLASMPKEWMVSSSRCRLALSSTRASPPMSPVPPSAGRGGDTDRGAPPPPPAGTGHPGPPPGRPGVPPPGRPWPAPAPGALPGEGAAGRGRRDRQDRRGGRLRRLPDQLRLGRLCRRLRHRGGLLRPRQHLVRAGTFALRLKKLPFFFISGAVWAVLPTRGRPPPGCRCPPGGRGGPNGLRGGRPLLPLAPARALRLLLRLILIAGPVEDPVRHLGQGEAEGPSPASRKASTNRMVEPRRLNTWTLPWASTPPSTPPEVSSSPRRPQGLHQGGVPGRTLPSSPWTMQEKSRGSSRPQVTRRRTGRPRWKARI